MEIINSGKATGYIYNLNQNHYFYKKVCSDVKQEEKLFLKAIKSFEEKLNVLHSKTTKNIQELIEMYITFLNDDYVNKEVIERINNKNECAGFAYHNVISKYALKLNESKDKYLKQRADDFIDIKDKVLDEMYEAKEELFFDKPTILVVYNLTMSLSLTLPKNVKAVISKKGEPLSHAAIVMRERNIPFVVSKEDFVNGKIYLIDTNDNIIKEVPELKICDEDKTNLKEEDVKKLPFDLYLNLSSIDNLKVCNNNFYKGVGLVRTEHLFINDLNYPYVDQQIKYYKELLNEFYPRPVKIRMFDIKKDKKMHVIVNEEIDEFKLHGPLENFYKDQLKAFVLANEPFGNLNITIPMIRNKSEYDNVISYLEILKEELNLVREIPKVGIMLETKEVLKNIKEFKDVKYLSVGTNDLTKELFEIDRAENFNQKEITDKLFKQLASVIKFSKKHNIPYTYCGDFISTRYGLTKLLKKGERNISIARGILEEVVITTKEYENKTA